MAEAVKLSYGEMLEYCGRLKSLATQYSDTAQEVTNVVSAFTGVWEGTAEAKFEEDYNVLTNAMTTAVETMQEITTLAEKYVNTMQEVENAYGVDHVTVG